MSQHHSVLFELQTREKAGWVTVANCEAADMRDAIQRFRDDGYTSLSPWRVRQISRLQMSVTQQFEKAA